MMRDLVRSAIRGMIGLVLVTAAIADDRVLVDPLGPLAREQFLTGGKAGSLAIILKFGEGAGIRAAKAARELSIVRRGRCYLVPEAAINNGRLWFMVNNGRYGESGGQVSLSPTARHYKQGARKGESSSRSIFRIKRYSTLSFGIISRIEQADEDTRPVFSAGTEESDLIVINLKALGGGFDESLDGQYYFMVDDRIAYEKLVPGCRKIILFPFFGS